MSAPVCLHAEFYWAVSRLLKCTPGEISQRMNTGGFNGSYDMFTDALGWEGSVGGGYRIPDKYRTVEDGPDGGI